jgi:hypothetical protein
MNSCTQCKIEKPNNEFRTIHYTLCGRCKECCLKNKLTRDANRCNHGLIQSQCLTCDGTRICIHKRFLPQCHICNGCTICIHDKMKFQCKECLTPEHVLIRNILHNSKRTDKKNEKYDELNFIDYDFINDLIKNNKKCYYCKIDMQYLNYDSTLCTIERKNNILGHIKSNCTLCCKLCNVKNKQIILTA